MDDVPPARDGWEDELERWLEPFLQRLRRKAQRRWAPFYLKGLILAFAFLQHLRLRLGGKKRRHPARAARAATPTEPAGGPATHRGSPYPHPAALPTLPAALRASPPAMN